MLEWAAGLGLFWAEVPPPHMILSLNILFKRHGKSQDISHEHT